MPFPLNNHYIKITFYSNSLLRPVLGCAGADTVQADTDDTVGHVKLQRVKAQHLHPQLPQSHRAPAIVFEHQGHLRMCNESSIIQRREEQKNISYFCQRISHPQAPYTALTHAQQLHIIHGHQPYTLTFPFLQISIEGAVSCWEGLNSQST